jgi:hypothetical protein
MAELTPEPLPKAIYDKAKSLGITKICLGFSGGSDEGYLDIRLYKSCESDSNSLDYVHHNDFKSEIDDWAWIAYEYGGAGDGNSYGDDITYDLHENTVSSCDWYMARIDGTEVTDDLEIAEQENKDLAEVTDEEPMLNPAYNVEVGDICRTTQPAYFAAFTNSKYPPLEMLAGYSLVRVVRVGDVDCDVIEIGGRGLVKWEPIQNLLLIASKNTCDKANSEIKQLFKKGDRVQLCISNVPEVANRFFHNGLGLRNLSFLDSTAGQIVDTEGEFSCPDGLDLPFQPAFCLVEFDTYAIPVPCHLSWLNLLASADAVKANVKANLKPSLLAGRRKFEKRPS